MGWGYKSNVPRFRQAHPGKFYRKNGLIAGPAGAADSLVRIFAEIDGQERKVGEAILGKAARVEGSITYYDEKWRSAQ